MNISRQPAVDPLLGAASLDGKKPLRSEDLPGYRVVRPFNVGDSPVQTPAGAYVATGDIPNAALARLIEVGAVVDEDLVAAEEAAATARQELDRVEGLRELFDLEDGSVMEGEDPEGLPAARASASDALAKLKTERARVARNLASLRATTNKE